MATPKLQSLGKKYDDFFVPTEHWLHWLNDDREAKLSQEEWECNVAIIQECFLLLRWRRNVTRSFWRWFKKKESLDERDRLRDKRELMMLWVLCRYRWSKSGNQQYTRELLLLQKSSEDIKAARDYVIRACLSS